MPTKCACTYVIISFLCFQPSCRLFANGTITSDDASRDDSSNKVYLKFCTDNYCNYKACYCCLTDLPHPRCYYTREECKAACPACNPQCPPAPENQDLPMNATLL
ncbi:hypothetical protein BDA96_02G061000 [Sorghum bicolor]|uniref:Bowman-Birk serine protease inhibitors family domain-containing protein n=2 Tax=Sorghum bicolor TaxID=4558 RepID=A0A921RN12_SORBI|nr:hypothetical protein BDA96_02G061000 [Sorghum bicolor]OQU88601.1 hypothetical protein SORBI_3002G060750 [Sorghum bicolor]